METQSQLQLGDYYTYEPLPNDRAIRLIQLVVDATQPHGYSLTSCTVNLTDAPLYCALSYTWKSATVSGLESHADDEKPPVMVNVQCDGRSLAITENAFDFLCRAFRDRLFVQTEAGQEHMPGIFKLYDSQTTAQRGVYPQHV